MSHNILNKEDFEQKLIDAGDTLVIVDFYDNSCGGPCKYIDRYAEKLSSSKYYNKMIVLKVNVDDCDGIAQAYDITYMPSVVFMKNRRIKLVQMSRSETLLAYNMENYTDPDLIRQQELMDAMGPDDIEDCDIYLEDL